MQTILHVFSAEETERVGNELAKILEENHVSRAVIAMRGEMGVGKTAFTRGFASHFGIASVKSPTYTVLNEYRGRTHIHHFDFYRIEDEDDLYSIGYFDIIESDGYSIGEWSENIEESLPDGFITVSIARVPDGSADERRITIELPDDTIKAEVFNDHPCI